MNKITLVITAIYASLCISSCSKKPQITISLNGFTNDTIVIAQVPLAEYHDILNDGDPRIKWDTIAPQNSTITIQPADRTSLYSIIPCQFPGEFLKMIITPQDRINIDMDSKNDAIIYTTIGSQIADGVNDYNQMMGETATQIRQARNKAEASQEILDSLYDVRTELTTSWIKKNINNPTIALYFKNMSPDTIVNYYKQLSPQMLESEVGPLLESAYRRADKFIKIRNAKTYIQEGVMAPDFTLPDNKNQQITFSSLRGKWAVLDFWGTWCGWCLKGIQDMKEAQTKLADKCEFISIACNDKQEDWLAALEKYDMPWIQLYVPTNLPTDLNPTVLYAIQGYPTKIIVNPNGVIEKIFIGETPEFYQALNKLVK